MTDYFLHLLTKYFLPWAKKNIATVTFGAMGLILLISGTVITMNGLKQETPKNETKILRIEKPSVENRKIKIEVSGEVIKPGVYEFTGDIRVQDALIAAGGLAVNADRNWVEKNLNLAQKLTDGMKIYIPRVGETVKTTNASSISLNNATQAELESLDGIGAATAKKIIAGRPYSSVEEICTRKIITRLVCDKIKEKITL